MANVSGGAVTIRLSVKDGEKVRAALKAIGVDGKKALDQLDEATQRPSKALLAVSDVMADLKAEAQGMAAQLGPAGVALSRMGPVGTVAAAGAAAFAGAVVTVIKSLAELKQQSLRAGVDVEQFQALAYAAGQSKVPVDALTDGLKELQLRADEFVTTGGGPAAEAFGRLGYSASDLRAKLQDPVDLFQEIIDKLRTMDKAAQIRILDEVFGGTGGEQFLALMDQFGESIRARMDDAHRLGIVIDDELVNKAGELDAKFNQVGATIESRLKTAVVEMAGFVADVIDNVDDLRRALDRVGDSDIWNKIYSWLGASPEDIAKAKLTGRLINGVSPDLSEWGSLRGSGPPPTEITINAPNRLAGLNSTFATGLQQMVADAASQGLVIGITSGFRTTQRQAELWAEALKKYGSPEEARKWVAPPGTSQHEKGMAADLSFGNEAAREFAHQYAGVYGLSFPLGNEPWHVEPTNGRARDASADAAKRQADAIRKVTEALNDEIAVVSLSARETALYNELKKAGVSIDSEAGRSIAAKVSALYDLREAQDAAAKSSEKALETTQEGLDLQRGVIGDLAHGLKEASKDGLTFAETLDVLLDALNRLADRLLDMALDQLFAPQAEGGAGFNFMSLFSGLGGLFGGGGGSTVPLPLPKPAIVAHGGGVVGMAGLGSRSITADFLSGAPRMHGGGLSGGERAAILMEGEGVFTRSQMRALGLLARGGGDGGIGKVEIYDQRSGGQLETEERRGPNGERQLRAVIRDEIGRGLRRGGQIDTVMRDRGLGERPARR